MYELGIFKLEEITVCIIIERIRIQGRGRISADEFAGAILLEQANHGRAARSSIKPSRKRSRGRRVPGLEKPEPHVHVLTDGEVTRILIDTLGGLTDARVCHKFHLGARRSMLKNGQVLAITLNERAPVDLWSRRGERDGSEGEESGDEGVGQHAEN